MDVVLHVPCVRVLSTYNETLASRYVCMSKVFRERERWPSSTYIHSGLGYNARRRDASPLGDDIPMERWSGLGFWLVAFRLVPKPSLVHPSVQRRCLPGRVRHPSRKVWRERVHGTIVPVCQLLCLVRGVNSLRRSGGRAPLPLILILRSGSR